MKRKADDSPGPEALGQEKKPATDANGVHQRFGNGVFEPTTLHKYTSEYAQSGPYRHAVVSDLINDDLLRAVRTEIVDNIHFTPKETDIYKIHQSGDLANLDGLPASALERLPSLLQLRDALYSYDFRQWLSAVTGAGALSGKKTDMAVNLYVPGCHLLCHDDVIGSRRVSYILYLTDPDTPWKAEWGGALRLYPTRQAKDDSGKTFKVPQPEWTKVIPPAWNQLSFFAVQPGESFHDVEEVYKRAHGDDNADGGRFRMAISGWFHIPQEGEDGFEAGLEERLAEKSSLQQLQGKADQFDEPQTQWQLPRETQPSAAATDGEADDEEAPEMSQADLEFLLQFITPNYLTPDTVEELNEIFAEASTLQLSNFLSTKFAERLRESIEQGDAAKEGFRTSKPPHKHRYQYIQASSETSPSLSVTEQPFSAVLNILLPSSAFIKWLSLATGVTLGRASAMARRFRRGLDYQLAQGYSGEDPQLEYCLCVTPSKGWGGDEDEPAENGYADVNGKGKGKGKQVDVAVENGNGEDEDNVGGYELYMAGEDDADDDDDGASHDGVEIPARLQSQTGAGDRRNAKRKKADPAIYKAADEDEDDGILLSLPASWNTLSVTLRDQGTLKFVKYVSQSAPGDRYDFVGSVEADFDDDAEDDEDDE